jgi:flagellar motor switch protein FliM
MTETIEKNVQAYDFKRSKRISKDHRAGFEYVSQAIAKMLTAYFTTLFRKLVEVKPSNVMDANYYDYIESREDPSCLWVFEDLSSPNTGILQFQSDFTFLIVDRLFSGRGMKLGHSRPLTGIEQSILKRVIERTLQIWDQAWKPIHSTHSRTSGFENHAYLVQIAGRNDPTILFKFDLAVEGDNFAIEMCLPYTYMAPFMLNMKDQSWMVLLDDKGQNTDRDKILPTVLKTKNQVNVSLGSAHISIQDYVGLRVGNLVKLDKHVEQPLVAYVADKPCFWVKPGIKENKKVIKILQRYKEADEEWIMEN